MSGERALRLVRFHLFIYFFFPSFVFVASCVNSSPLKYRVMSVAFSPNCKQVASSSKDKSVKLWNIQTGTCESTMNRPSESSFAAFSADGQWVVSGSMDKTICVWDAHAVAQ